MTLERKLKCPKCGEPKGSRQVLCKSCWLRVPINIRIAFNTASVSERRALLRKIF